MVVGNLNIVLLGCRPDGFPPSMDMSAVVCLRCDVWAFGALSPLKMAKVAKTLTSWAE